MRNRTFFTAALLTATIVGFAGGTATAKEFANTIGMKMVRIEPGTFMMGWEGFKVPPVRLFPWRTKTAGSVGGHAAWTYRRCLQR
jgi:formylglycine-generating enzyme required for sulfatase activity